MHSALLKTNQLYNPLRSNYYIGLWESQEYDIIHHYDYTYRLLYRFYTLGGDFFYLII